MVKHRSVHLAVAEFFTVVFYGVKYFSCNMVQFCATRRESKWLKGPSSVTVRKLVKTNAKTLS